jgi:hypothetical protein
MRQSPVAAALCAFVIFLGVAITRVGLYGQHLGGLRLVSNVKKYAGAPRWQHRCMTAGCGIVMILLGAAGLIILFVLGG